MKLEFEIDSKQIEKTLQESVQKIALSQISHYAYEREVYKSIEKYLGDKLQQIIEKQLENLPELTALVQKIIEAKITAQLTKLMRVDL